MPKKISNKVKTNLLKKNNSHSPAKANKSGQTYQTAERRGGGWGRVNEQPPRREEGVICGKNPVLEALRSGRTINKVLAAAGQEPGFLRQVRELCRERHVPFFQVERAKLAAYPDNRGVVALTSPFAYAEVEDILAAAKAKGEEPLVIVLAGVEDPHNLGAVLRTAEGVGAHGVIIAKHGAAPLNETAARVAAGAAEYVPVARVSSIAATLDELKEQGLWVCGTRQEGAQTLWQADLRGALAVVLGSEGKGLPALVAKKCDFMVQIPMRGKINSFNVSVSCAMVLGEVLRQRTDCR